MGTKETLEVGTILIFIYQFQIMGLMTRKLNKLFNSKNLKMVERVYTFFIGYFTR